VHTDDVLFPLFLLQLAQREPYREVIQQRTITRLQRDVRRARKGSRKKKSIHAADVNASHRSHRSQRSSSAVGDGDSTDGSGMIEASLATVEALSRQVAEYAERNRELQASVQSQAALNATSVDASVSNLQSGFQQGVVWFGRQALAAVDDLGEQVSAKFVGWCTFCSCFCFHMRACPLGAKWRSGEVALTLACAAACCRSPNCPSLPKRMRWTPSWGCHQLPPRVFANKACE